MYANSIPLTKTVEQNPPVPVDNWKNVENFNIIDKLDFSLLQRRGRILKEEQSTLTKTQNSVFLNFGKVKKLSNNVELLLSFHLFIPRS